MIRTAVGYSGGTTPDPTYTNLGDHSESIEIQYDPSRVTYAELLGVFWESHNAASAPTCRQYRSAIFYHDEEQRLLAEQTKASQQEIHGAIYTVIEPVGPFYRAEDYHQKWYLRNRHVLWRDFESIYPDPQDFADSTAAARVNGVVGGYYTAARLEQDLPGFGLSEESNAVLRELAQD